MPRWWLRSRNSPDLLGQGVWRRADDRFRRAVDRYHQVLERVEPLLHARGADIAETGRGHGDAAELDEHLVGTGAALVALLPRVHDVCVRAQELAPSDTEIIPAGLGGVLLDVHRALARAATLVAQSAEAVTLVLVTVRAASGAQPGASTAGTTSAAGRSEAGAAALAAARAAEQAGAHVARAESLIRPREPADRA